MKIHGFNKLTLLDYPGHVGATLFLGGCNFRCPYCQNGNLVTTPEQEPWIPEDEVFDYLKKRHGILEGVCVSGGEPTLHKSLPDFIAKLKALGYLVKLDTNGTNPEMVKALVKDQLLDFVAMDIKTSKEHYATVSNCPTLDIHMVEKTVDFLLSGNISYEFRTTVVRELHQRTDFEAIADWLAGCQAYFLQSYKDSENVIESGFSAYSKSELTLFKDILSKKIPRVELRGID